MRLSITSNFPDLQRRLSALRSDVQNTVAARAINRVADQAKTQMTREIASEYRVLSRDVRERLKVKRATGKAGMIGIEAELRADGKRAANLIRFNARQTRTGVTFSVKKGSRKTIRDAFIGNKGRTVFARIPGTTMPSRSKYSGTKHAEKIKAVSTIYVPQMFNQRRINAAVVQAIKNKFPAAFEHEVRFAEGRFKR